MRTGQRCRYEEITRRAQVLGQRSDPPSLHVVRRRLCAVSTAYGFICGDHGLPCGVESELWFQASGGSEWPLELLGAVWRGRWAWGLALGYAHCAGFDLESVRWRTSYSEALPAINWVQEHRTCRSVAVIDEYGRLWAMEADGGA